MLRLAWHCLPILRSLQGLGKIVIMGVFNEKGEFRGISSISKALYAPETVELVYSYVNQVPAEQLTESGGEYCIPAREIPSIREAVCGPLDLENEELQFYFKGVPVGWKGTTFILPGLLHGLQHPESRLQQRGGDGPFPEKWMVSEGTSLSGLWHQWNWPGPDCC